MKRRLDLLLVERGLAPSRERARALILAGQVAVDGQVVSKAGTGSRRTRRSRCCSPITRTSGRGGLKLAHALDTFGIAVDGREALDIGASTGGFTDVLLQARRRRAWSRSTSATASSTGGCATTRVSSSSRA